MIFFVIDVSVSFVKVAANYVIARSYYTFLLVFLPDVEGKPA